MEELDQKFIDIYKEIGRRQGLGELSTTIFARLYIEPGDIAMDDLAKETGYSLASISNKINMLSTIASIKKIKKPGTKKIFLYVEKDIVKLFKDALIQKEDNAIHVIKEKLPPLIKDYKKKAKTECDKQKIKIMEDYYNQIIKSEIIIHETIEKFEHLK